MRGTVTLWWLAATAAASPADPEIRGRIQEILARPEFHAEQQVPPRWLTAFFAWLAGLYDTAPLLYWLLLIGCLLLLIALVAHIGYTVYRVLSYSRRYGPEETVAARRRRLSAECLAEAQRRAEQRDYTEAIRFLFLSLVHRFDESGKVGLRQDLTNREYLGLFHDRVPVQARLKVFVDTLDENWYGQHPTARIQYDDCWQLFQECDQALPAPA